MILIRGIWGKVWLIFIFWSSLRYEVLVVRFSDYDDIIWDGIFIDRRVFWKGFLG